MAKKRSVKSELGDLQAQLKRAEAETPAAEPEAAAKSEAERLLHELESHLGKAGEEAEELVKHHPLAAVAAAFLLGLLAGRVLGR
jgi:ElaB/YqjD/DUF883 family membrane-anchored ribosome-binding protein